MNPFDKPIEYEITSEGVKWKDDSNVTHYMTAKGVIEHLKTFYENSWYATMNESSTGEWVKLSTFNDTVAMLNAQIDRLKKQLEDKAKEEAPEIKIGDKLRIINTEIPGGKWGHVYKVGTIVVVESIEPVEYDEINDYELEYNVALDTNTYKPLRQVINKDDFVKV